MVIVINNDFSVAKIEPSTIYKGSDNATTLYVFAPFNTSDYAAIKVCFELPSGDCTEPFALFATEEQPSKDSGFGCWSMKLPGKVTQSAGMLKATFAFVGTNGSTQPTETASIPIAKNSPSIPPQTPDADVYQQILAYLNSIADKFKSGVQNGYVITGVSDDNKTVYISGFYSSMVEVGETVQIMIKGIIPDWSATVESVSLDGNAFNSKTAITLSEAFTEEFVKGNTYLVFPNDTSKGNEQLVSHSLSFGSETEARTSAATTFGTGTKSDAPNQIVGGRYNAPAPDSLFVMGNGANDTERSNAGGLRKSGRFWQQNAPETDDELVRLGDLKSKTIESIDFDDDGKLVISFKDGKAPVTMTGSWLSTVENGGNIPPTADAVKEYAVKRRKVTDAGHYVYTETSSGTVVYPVAQATVSGKPNIPLRDKNGHLRAADPEKDEHLATKKYVDGIKNTLSSYRHEITIRHKNNDVVDVQCVIYLSKRTPLADFRGSDYKDFLMHAVGSPGVPCTGTVNGTPVKYLMFEDVTEYAATVRFFDVEEYNVANFDYNNLIFDDSVSEYDIREIEANALKFISYNPKDGVLKLATLNGKEFTIDLPIESIISNVYYDDKSERLIFEKPNGEDFEVPVSNLLNPAWTTDVSEGGATPPTAEAVKEYADTKVPSINRKWATKVVYGTYSTGVDGFHKLTTDPTANAVPQYDGDKCLSTDTPKLDVHAANKKYVDDAIANAGGGEKKLYKHNIRFIFNQYADESYEVLDGTLSAYCDLYTYRAEPFTYDELINNGFKAPAYGKGSEYDNFSDLYPYTIGVYNYPTLNKRGIYLTVINRYENISFEIAPEQISSGIWEFSDIVSEVV